MKTTRTYGWSLAVAAFLGVALLPGCELLVQFDRNKIDGGAPDVTTPPPQGDSAANPDGGEEAGDVTVEAAPEAEGTDAEVTDASDSGEAGNDAAGDADANEDAPTDSPGDTTSEESAEASAETGADSEIDAMDAGTDATDDGADSTGPDGGD